MVLGCDSPGLYSRGRLNPQVSRFAFDSFLGPACASSSEIPRCKFGQIAAVLSSLKLSLHVCMLQHTGFASDRKPQSAVWISVGRSWTCASGGKKYLPDSTVSCFSLRVVSCVIFRRNDGKKSCRFRIIFNHRCTGAARIPEDQAQTK